MTRRPSAGRCRAAFFSVLTLGLTLLGTAPARGQTPPTTPTPSPATSVTPVPSGAPTPMTAPFSGEGPSITQSPVPIVPQSPGASPNLPSPSPSPNGSPTPKPDKIQTRSDEAENHKDDGISILRGNVHVDYGAVRVDAQEIRVDQNKHEIQTDSAFSLSQPDPQTPGENRLISGMGLRYNYDTDESTVYNANVSTPAQQPGQRIFIRAKEVKGQGQDRFDATDAVFTTCDEILDEKTPHYHVECRSLQYFAGDRIVAWDAKIYLNGKYTFWLPVVVIPLKKEGNSLDIGRNDIEGFYIRRSQQYALPALVNGYLLNNGRIITNGFEKKGLGVGIEHTINWGYYATTYGYFYGLVSPDRDNLLQTGNPQNLTVAEQDQQVAQNERLFGLYGGPFQDHQMGLEHRQHIIGNLEAGGRIQDDNIYDPLTPNYRVNRGILRADLKDNISALGLTYSLGYDSTDQRGTQTLGNGGAATQYNESLSQSINNQAAFKVANTSVSINNAFTRQHQTTVVLATPSPAPGATPDPTASFDPSTYVLQHNDGGGTDQLTTNVNLSASWPGNINSTLALPYHVSVTETPIPSPQPSVSPEPGVSPVPSPSASPWMQNIQPALDVSGHIPNVGQLEMQASKYFDLTQATPAPAPSPGTSAADLKTRATALQSAIRAQGQFDKLPEFTLTSDPFFPDIQPVALILDYGRFFEYQTFKIAPAADLGTYTGTPDRYFPGPYIDRLNPVFRLNSKGQDVGFNSLLDFGGTGYRQFFYSTKDEQYAIDEQARLTTNWSKLIQTNINYVNNITPDAKNFPATNNSPLNQDAIGTSKQTHLTGDFDVKNDPYFNYTLGWGYDYLNRAYDTLQNNLSWRTQIPETTMPLGLTLNAQFQPTKITDGPNVGGLKLLGKPLDIRYLPKVPLYGIDGTWLPVTGTLTLRSDAEVFGGAFGAKKILPGWQFDNQMAYDFNTGLWQSLLNRLYITFGDKWQNHLELVLGGYYDTTPTSPGYRFSTFGINKDLHDFILSFQYDRIASYYSISLTMVAFPSQPLNFTSNSFNRLNQTGATGLTNGGTF